MFENLHSFIESLKMSSDPISGALSLVNARASCVGGLRASGSWALAFPPPDKIKFFVVGYGECWLAMDHFEAPIQFQTGDVFMIAGPQPFLLASDMSIKPIDSSVVFVPEGPAVQVIGDGNETFLIGGYVNFDSSGGQLLVDGLPRSLHIRPSRPEAAKLKWMIQQLVEEHDDVRPGTDFARQGLAQLIFLQMLRCHLDGGDALPSGWLRVMSDSRLASAVELIHRDPTRDWHLPELARAAAMSRATFAARFKAAAGVAPLAYVAVLRMYLAKRLLTQGGLSLSQIARSTGFGSDAAFSTAFKRITGVAPTHYRHQAVKASEATMPAVL